MRREREPETKKYHGVNSKLSRQKVRDGRSKGLQKGRGGSTLIMISEGVWTQSSVDFIMSVR